MQASGPWFSKKYPDISDAGRYVPYISSAFLDQKDTSLFDLKGMENFHFLFHSEAISSFYFPLSVEDFVGYDIPQLEMNDDDFLAK